MGVAQDPKKRRIFIGLYHGGFKIEEIRNHPDIGLSSNTRVYDLIKRMVKEGWIKPEIREDSEIMLGRSHDLKWISPKEWKIRGNQG